MNEPNNQRPKEVDLRDLLPVPYSIITMGWVVLLVLWNRLFHEIPWLVWLSGPVVLLTKVFLDAERIGRIKDNPSPVIYNFHAPGVWAQLDQTIRTVPASFKNVQTHIDYQNLNPQKDKPMQMDVTITLRHPDVDKSHVSPAKQFDMKSTIVMNALITPMGNQTKLEMTFKTDALITRRPLDEIIDYIQQNVTALVEQYAGKDRG